MTRAPGRLDVMGGIADYSGSLVLQVGFLISNYFHFTFFLIALPINSLEGKVNNLFQKIAVGVAA